MISILLILLLIINNNLIDDIDLALESIRKAEDIGADTSILVDELNSILECEDCNDIKDRIKAIIDEADELRYQALANNSRVAVVTYLSAVIGAFLASFFGIYLYDLWLAYRDNRFLNMRIREKED
ncbi:MAG: hypothetical protein KatS3mg003_0655 [Candidatus Nitrosocaldaceae archaeon]|nr:MAG: hypothetical protein KatS3mg003_0655 [Candidatus Nitrosocaldaceae archaeon]